MECIKFDNIKSEIDKMDYKEKYQKALECAKKGMPIDEVFPELKESDDEKIRKELLEYFNQFENGELRGVDITSWIAYLERQKEYVSDNFDDVWTTEDCTEIIEAGEKLSPRFKELFKEVCHAWYDKGIELEKQKEKKPARWSEEDKTMLERCISKMVYIIPVPGKHGITDMSFETHTDNELADWLKYLPERFNLQPKQEWSEEDEKKISFICHLIERNLPEGQYSFGDGGKGGFVTTQEAIEMVKSFRPHWKPSKEQMNALWGATEKYLESDNEKVREIRGKVLESLYNDLEKQMEE